MPLRQCVFALLMAPLVAWAEPDPTVEPVSVLKLAAVTTGVAAAGYAAMIYGPPTEPPYDKYAHGAVGAAVAATLAEYTSPAIGLAAATVVGIAKEKYDKEFDWADAGATILGGAVGLALWYEFAPGADSRLFFTPRGIVFTTKF